MMNKQFENSNPEQLVSIVVPYYEHQVFVERCLNSVALQSYENLELIVIDDCSPDNSGEFVEQLCQDRELQKRFAGRIYFESLKKNLGAHHAINYGINKAKGKFISILNSDDMYHQSRIQLMIKELEDKKADFVFSRVSCIDDKDRDITESHSFAINLRKLQEKIKNFPTVGFSFLHSNIALSTGNFVFAKDLYDKLLGFQDYRYCHDWDFILRAILINEPVFLDEDLYYYRIHEKNTFGTVHKLAVTESASVLRNYFNQARVQPPLNCSAPCSFNWPNYFDLFIDLMYYRDLYDGAIALS